MRTNDQIDQTRFRVEGRAAAIIDEITGAAKAAEMAAPLERLSEMRAHLRTSNDDKVQEELFCIVVCGRMRNGKSTVLNALLGKATAQISGLAGEKGPMPTAYGVPTTAVTTQVRYADKPYVRAWHFDDTSEEWSFERYLVDGRQWKGIENNKKLFENIKMFEVGFPGESINTSQTEITLEALREKADAAILLYTSDAVAAYGEQTFASLVKTYSGHTFHVINRFRGFEFDPPFLANAAERLGFDPTVFIPDPARFDVFGVEALQALDASLAGDDGGLERSGLAAFERRLSQFLLVERYPAHAEKICKTIDLIAERVLEGLGKRGSVLQADVIKLEQAISECRKKLDEIEQRKERIVRLIDRAGREIERTASDSYRNMLADLIDDLPNRFAATPIPSLKSVGDRLKALFDQRYAKDAVKVLNELVADAHRAWGGSAPGGTELDRVLAPIFERLRDDIREECRGIDENLLEIRVEIANLDPTFQPEAAPVVSTWERITWIGIGIVVGDLSLGLTGGAGGWRAVAGSMGSAVATGVLLALFHVALGPVGLIAIIVAAMGGGAGGAAMGIESRLRKAALKAYIPQLREFRASGKADELIGAELRKPLALMKTSVERSVGDIIGYERSEIEELFNTRTLDYGD